VILVDANLLIYAYVASLHQHEAAASWLDAQLNSGIIVALPWPSLLSFARLVTNPRVFERPALVRAAWNQIEHWLNCASVRIPAPGDRHREILGNLIIESVDRADLIPDAHLAAIAIENGFLLCSSDRDFARFPGLRWQNPLTSTADERQ
jgi:toxin-antitoxin system PIN domain toxin